MGVVLLSILQLNGNDADDDDETNNERTFSPPEEVTFRLARLRVVPIIVALLEDIPFVNPRIILNSNCDVQYVFYKASCIFFHHNSICNM